MSYYLVDYENVKVAGLHGVNKLSGNDTVCIFYSDKSDTLTFDIHKQLNESKATVIFQKVNVGTPNALDFQLATYLGYLIAQDSTREYFIISKDKGFSVVKNYWESKKINLTCITQLSEGILINSIDTEAIEPSYVSVSEKSKESDLTDKVKGVISDKNIVQIVVAVITKYPNKQAIYNALINEFPIEERKKAQDTYREIKPLLKEIKK
jgi:hypothetical protein